jgi:hypothetical protein
MDLLPEHTSFRLQKPHVTVFHSASARSRYTIGGATISHWLYVMSADPFLCFSFLYMEGAIVYMPIQWRLATNMMVVVKSTANIGRIHRQKWLGLEVLTHPSLPLDRFEH